MTSDSSKLKLIDSGLTGMDVMITWLSRWIHPLQVREHSMYEHMSLDDLTRGRPYEMAGEMLAELAASMTKEHTITLLPHAAP